jgi:hypothetical protein
MLSECVAFSVYIKVSIKRFAILFSRRFVANCQSGRFVSMSTTMLSMCTSSLYAFMHASAETQKDTKKSA